MASSKKKKQPEKKVIYLASKSENKSAARLKKELKNLGVENREFFMAVHNENLMEKDPYSPTLKMEDVRDISNECEENIWFYLRECLMLRKDVGSETLEHYPLTKRAVAAFWLVINGYSILLDMDKKDGQQIAHAIMQYFHQCGPKKHFEVISKTDEEMYDQTEYSAYYLTAPMYIFSQNNTEPIFNDTEEVLMDEIKYSKSGAYLYLDNFFTFEEAEAAFTKWTKGSRRPILIVTKYGKDSDNEVSRTICDTNVFDWDESFYDDQKLLQEHKKNHLIRIK